MPVYFDHNATTPLAPRVLDAMLPYLGTEFGNPSSAHGFGRVARAAIDTAREQVASLVNAQPSQVIFTSGGTEANNLALLGSCANQSVGRIAVSAIEHDSVLGPARELAGQGWMTDSIKVDRMGRVTGTALRAALHPDTRLVSVMLANNETGVIQDLPALSQIARAAGVVMHTDAVQAAGKIPVDFAASGAQLLSISAHKLYGPKGVGALIVDKALDLRPRVHGGGQERGLRPGTENVAGIAGFGMAAQIAQEELHSAGGRLTALRAHLESGLRAAEPGLVILAADAPRVPNTVQISVPGIDGEALLLHLDRAGFAVSSGSACASGSHEPSHVLVAMGVERDVARGAVRISLGRTSTREQVDALCDAFAKVLSQLRSGAAVRAAAGL